MTTIEKTLLVASIFLSWGFGFLIWVLFQNDVAFQTTLSLILGGVLLWLTPFAFLALFFEEIRFPLFTFALGSFGFFLAVQNFYLSLGLLLLFLSFTYWFLRVRYARDTSPGFSVLHSMKGIGFFFTILAAFGGLVYSFSPFLSVKSLEPKVPEKFFDVVYYPLSKTLLSQVPKDPRIKAPTPEELKPQIYQVVNAALGELALKYQRYIPFAFAAGAFFFLRAVFIPIKYLLLLITFLLVRIFLKVGWLHKEKVEMEREVVKF